MTDNFKSVQFATFVKTHKAVTKKDYSTFIENINIVLPQGSASVKTSKLKAGSYVVMINPDGVLHPWPLVTDVLLPAKLLHCQNYFHATNTDLRTWMVEKRAQQDVVKTLTVSSTTTSTALTVHSSTASTCSDDGAQACMILATVRNTSTVQILEHIKQDLQSYQNSHSDALARYIGIRTQTLQDITEQQRIVKDLEKILDMEVKKRNTYKSQVAEEMQALDGLVDDLKSIRHEQADLKEQEQQIADTERHLKAKAADLQAIDQDFDNKKQHLVELQKEISEEIAEEEKRLRLKRKLAIDDNRLLARERDIERRERILSQREDEPRNIDISSGN